MLHCDGRADNRGHVNLTSRVFAVCAYKPKGRGQHILHSCDQKAIT